MADREGTVITDTVYATHPRPMRLIPFRMDVLSRRNSILQRDQDRPLRLVAGQRPAPELPDAEPLRKPREVAVDTPCL